MMVVNDSPGEECRVAILQDNHLEELYTERTATATNVGNVYKGRVTNVEPAIQAAFVDYGQGQSGFLHISDLHPRYFPNNRDGTERVGMKIPRRDRPPIQEALKRGHEILVQVMKEGIGTKGPTLTSYVSIPGRMLVMMPGMDRVGVSRKVEDEQRRREMRQVLDTLDLPDGFGFILRTAGFGANKTELKRDAAYLLRLWKAMDKRISRTGAPCSLYTESDLLTRTIRDVLRPTITAIVVDSDSAYDRVNSFLSVIAPRSAPKLIRYRGAGPIFHAFDIERQIELIHSREVPLPSGGRLVIDQTEALVAIDVNSGKSRSATDAETNAYRTNIEAVDEIARQLRLRDLGGLVIHDLIDMRSPKHRRDIEERFRNNLKSDRARSTILRISEFGIVEMTRQRMRPGVGKSNFVACAHCQGRGEVKSPDYLGAHATRHTGFLLQYPQIARVEIVCSPHVASYLLSQRRRQLVELEDDTGKRIDVRVSEAIATDRVDFYAYDSRNADIAVEKLPVLPPPSMKALEAADRKAGGGVRPPVVAPIDDLDLDDEDIDLEAELERDDAPAPAGGRKKRRRGRRRAGERAEPVAAAAAAHPAAPPRRGESADGDDAPTGRKKRRRRRRGGRDRTAAAAGVEMAHETTAAGQETEQETAAPEAPELEPVAAAPARPARVHELAKELGLTSRDVLEHCREQGLEVRNHMSSLSIEDAASVRSALSSTAEPPATEAEDDEDDTMVETAQAEATAEAEAEAEAPTGKRRRRRRGRGGRGRGERVEADLKQRAEARERAEDAEAAPADEAMEQADEAPEFAEQPEEPRTPRRSKRRRRGGAGRETGAPAPANSAKHDDEVDTPEPAAKPAGRKRKRRRRDGGDEAPAPVTRNGQGASAGSAPAIAAEPAPAAPAEAPAPSAGADPEKPRRRRTLYRNRTKLSPAARRPAGGDDE